MQNDQAAIDVQKFCAKMQCDNVKVTEAALLKCFLQMHTARYASSHNPG